MFYYFDIYFNIFGYFGNLTILFYPFKNIFGGRTERLPNQKKSNQFPCNVSLSELYIEVLTTNGSGQNHSAQMLSILESERFVQVGQS